MSLQSRLSDLITAVGTDINALQGRAAVLETRSGRLYSTTFGNGVATTFVIAHYLGSRDVQVQIRQTAAPYELVNARVEATDANTVTIYTDLAPAAGAYTVVISVGGPQYSSASIVQDPWHVVGAAGEPAFQNGWVNYGTGYANAAFRKLPDGRIQLRGLIKSGAMGAVAFFLPVGYRPVGFTESALFSVVSNDAAGQLRIYTADGGVAPMLPSSPNWVSLDGVTFDTGQSSFPIAAQITPVLTALPVSPTDGQEILFLADATAGVIWKLRYRAYAADGVTANPSAYKWEYIGGPPLIQSQEAAHQTTAGAAYSSPATPVSIALALAGDYDITLRDRAYGQTVNTQLYTSFSIGATAAADADAIVHASNVVAINDPIPDTRKRRKTVAVAGSAIVMRHRSVTGIGQFVERQLEIVPVRVG